LSSEEQKSFDSQKKTLDALVDKRMEYINKFTYPQKDTPEYKFFVSAIDRSE